MTKNNVPFKEICQVSVPQETETYMPVSHEQAVSKLLTKLSDAHFKITNERYDLSREGKICTFNIGCDFDLPSLQDVKGYYRKHDLMSMDYLFAGINSYDKSSRLAYASGTQVFVCANGMISGEIKQLRKHTKYVFQDIDGMLDNIIREGEEAMRKNVEFSISAVSKMCTDNSVSSHLGRMVYKNRILNINEGTKVYKEYNKSLVFPKGNYWSFYNACTEVLKITRPDQQMKKQKKIHTYFDNQILKN